MFQLWLRSYTFSLQGVNNYCWSVFRKISQWTFWRDWFPVGILPILIPHFSSWIPNVSRCSSPQLRSSAFPQYLEHRKRTRSCKGRMLKLMIHDLLYKASVYDIDGYCSLSSTIGPLDHDTNHHHTLVAYIPRPASPSCRPHFASSCQHRGPSQWLRFSIGSHWGRNWRGSGEVRGLCQNSGHPPLVTCVDCNLLHLY